METDEKKTRCICVTHRKIQRVQGVGVWYGGCSGVVSFVSLWDQYAWYRFFRTLFRF